MLSITMADRRTTALALVLSVLIATSIGVVHVSEELEEIDSGSLLTELSSNDIPIGSCAPNNWPVDSSVAWCSTTIKINEQAPHISITFSLNPRTTFEEYHILLATSKQDSILPVQDALDLIITPVPATGSSPCTNQIFICICFSRS